MSLKHSPLPWIVRRLPRGGVGECFIQAARLKPTDPYDIEVMGDDTNPNLYPDELKAADAEFIVRACNNFEALVAGVDDLFEKLPEAAMLGAKLRLALAKAKEVQP